ncbi:MAG: hypothetical protein AABW73_02095 [Nanoarchaeota archaeon]
MIHIVHGKEVEYSGEQCGFYKFNGLIWDYIDMDMSMFLHGLSDVSLDEAKQKTKKMHDTVVEQLSWDKVPEITVRSTFLAPQKPRPISEVKTTLEMTKIVTQRVLHVIK